MNKRGIAILATIVGISIGYQTQAEEPQSISTEERAKQLRVLIQNEGIVNVARYHIATPKDEMLISLMARFEPDEAIQQQVEEEMQSLDFKSSYNKKVYISSAAYVSTGTLLEKEKAFDSNNRQYKMLLSNKCEDTIEELAIFVQLKDGSMNLAPITRKNILGTDSVIIQLGRCSKILQYSFGISVKGKWVVKFPPKGCITPQNSGEYNSEDKEPCLDTWEFICEDFHVVN